MKRFTCIIVILLSCTELILAQSFMSQGIPSTSNSMVGLRHFRQIGYSGIENYHVLTGIYDINGLFAVGKDWYIGGSLPVIHTSFDYTIKRSSYNFRSNASREASETTLGNLEIRTTKTFGKRNSSAVSMQMYLPVFNDEDNFGTEFSSLVHFYEPNKYFPNAFSFRLNYLYRYEQIDNLILAAEIGPQLWIPTDDSFDTDILINYCLIAGYKMGKIAAFVEAGGLTLATEKAFAERIDVWNLGLQLINAQFQPGIFYGDIFRSTHSGAVLGLKLDHYFGF